MSIRRDTMTCWSTLNNNAKREVLGLLGDLGRRSMAMVSRENRRHNVLQRHIQDVHQRTIRYTKQNLKRLDADSNMLIKRIGWSKNSLENRQSDRRELKRAASENTANITFNSYGPIGNLNKNTILRFLQNGINDEKSQLSRLRRELHAVQKRRKLLLKRMNQGMKAFQKTAMIRGTRR